MAEKIKSAKESRLVSDVIAAGWKEAWLTRVNTGTVKKEDGRWFKTGTPKGYPDISGNRRSDGAAIYIECKVKPNKPTPEQAEFIRQRREEGCLSGVCYSVEEALAIIRGEK